MVNERVIDFLVSTIETIASSPRVESYNIGITVNSTRRRNQYINFEPTWLHFVILRSGLSCSAARALEGNIHARMQSNKRSVAYRKNRDDTRDKPYTPSLGGLSTDNPRVYDLYMAWGNIGDN